MSRPFARLVLVVVLGLIAAACGDEPEAPVWAEEAEVYAQSSVDLINEQGPVGFVPFLAEEVVWDERTILTSVSYYESLDEAVLRSPFFRLRPGDLTLTMDLPAFLDRTGFVMAQTADVDLLGLGLDTASEHVAIVHGSVGPEGIEEHVRLPTTATWRQQPWREIAVADGADAVASRWHEIWSDPSAPAVRSLYAERAHLQDSLRGLDLVGPAAISARAELEADTAWTVVRVGDAPAVYPRSIRRDELTGVAFVTRGDSGSGCPGRWFIWLDLDAEGLVLAERRFWALDDARRCLGDRAPSGWWTGRPTPGPAERPFEDLHTVTATISTEAGTTDIVNGTPTLESLLTWAVARFDRAGLSPPEVDTVTFTSYTDYCADVQARAIPPEAGASTAGWSTVFCLSEGDVCSTAACESYSLEAKRAVLHELAHVWMAQNLTEAVRDAFVEFRGLETWQDGQREWAEQAREHAAEFMAWGLLDEAFGLMLVGLPSLEIRHLGFQLLTGHQALQASP